NIVFLRIGTPTNSGSAMGRVWSAQMPTMLRKGKRRASSLDEARSVSIAMSIGTYSCVCSAWIRMRVLACTPLPNSISWAAGPTLARPGVPCVDRSEVALRRQGRGCLAYVGPAGGEFQPLTYAGRVADTSVLAPGVQEHDDNRTLGQRHLHDETPPRLGDVP